MYNKKLKAMKLILQDPDANSVPVELIGHGDDSLNEITDEPTYDSSEDYSCRGVILSSGRSWDPPFVSSAGG